MSKISQHFDVREFVSEETFKKYGDASKWFVSDNILKLSEFVYAFFNDYYKKEQTVESVSILINDWAFGGTFNWRGLRTYEYIKQQVESGVKTATMSQHVGGSTNAIDFNVVVKYKNGNKSIIDSNKVREIIMAHEADFMAAGLTTLEDGHFAPGWCHADCRFTGMDEILIIKP